MKITTSHSSAKDKFFIGLWFVLFAGAILLVNWLFQLPVDRAGTIRDRLADTEKQITRLTALHAEFLLLNDKEDNLFRATGNNAENEIRAITRNIGENVSAIRNNKRIERNASSVLDEFSASISMIEAGINNLVLITNERGNRSKGIVSRWLNLSRNMLNSSAEANNDIREKLSMIRQLESEYLLNRDVKLLQDISIAAEEIRNQLTTEGEGIVITDIDTYMVLTSNLASIEKRMGHNNAQGIIPDLERSIQGLPEVYGTLISSIDQLFGRSLGFWKLARLFAILLVISMFIYFYLKFFALIDPLHQTAGFSRKLALGEFPEDRLETGNHADMKVVGDSLEKLVSALKDKFNFTRSLNQDILDATLTLSGEHDALGSELMQLRQKILDTNQKQAKNEEDNLVRRYMNEGLAKFADILRSKNSDIHMLGDAFIREIVKYLNALQGGLFIYDDSNPADPVLNLVSSFAYNRKKHLQQSVKLGEGLVGSCAREKQYMNMTEIPEGYISITSGLGDTPPDNLLLIPVMHENEILGVIEIASLNKFRNHEIEFAQEVAYNLGSTLVTTRNNQHTSELLEKSQQQALEMAEQEEEMRQNMEELKATQEESARREEELSGFAEAVDNSLMVIEYDLEGRIHEVNANLCRFLGREHDEIVGKLHQEVFAGSLNTDAAFWNELQQNGHVLVTESIKIGRKSFDINEHFARVNNSSNSTVKYINFATNGRIGNR